MDRFYNEDSENEKPFFGNHDDDDDDDDDIYDDMEDQTIAFIQHPDLVAQIDFAEYNFKQQLLDKAIKIAESSWLWRFKSSASKMKEIAIIYEVLAMITDDGPEPEEPAENAKE